GAFSHQSETMPEELVCESKEWVEQVTQERISKQLVLFCQPCVQALSVDSGLHYIPLSAKQGWGIWVLRSERLLMLITPSTDATTEKAEALAKSVAARLATADSTIILRASRRAYPALILADDELWIDLEKESLANMALSPEETEVL